MLFPIFMSLNAYSKTTCPVKVYGNSEKPPKYWLDENKQPQGILVDMVKEVGKDLGCEFEILLRPWARAFFDAKMGNGAIIGLSKTKDRQKIFYYSDEMFIDELILVTKKNKKFKYNSFNDFKGKVVGVGRSSTYGDAFDAKAESGLFKLNYDVNPTMRFQKLVDGETDVVVFGPGVLGYEMFLKTSPQILKYKNDLAILNNKFLSDPNFLGIKKSPANKRFLNLFNDALKRLKKSGKHKEIILKHFK